MSNLETFNYPSPKEKYKVLVRCFTYNQSKYIEDALNGFAMQQTNFPFVCLVMDDASTDGEQEVIKSWMERECDMSKAEFIDIPTSHVIIVPHKSNLSCTFAFYLLKQNLYGTGDKKMNHVYPWRKMCEYEALCEGDDYWTDPLKLQKQVDFLEMNSDYSMCFHNAIVSYHPPRKESHLFNKLISINKEISFNEIVNEWIIPTASIIFRTKILPLPDWANQIYSGDFILALWAKNKGRIYYLNEIMSCYRKTETGVSNYSVNSVIFVCKQKVKLFKLFNEETNKQYDKLLNNRITFYEKSIRYYTYKQKSILLAIIEMPLFSLKRMINFVKSKF